LRFLQSEHHLDLSQVVVAGHSAGGHLALWAAGRPNVSEESPLYREAPLSITGVVCLNGPGQLAPLRNTDNEDCGGDVVDMLMGGSPEEVPDNYAAGSPIQLLPLGVPFRLLTGADDYPVLKRLADTFAAAAVEAGDDVKAVTLERTAHFETIVPGTDVWPEVRSTILDMFGKFEQ
jgi:pimeloyl-ACP methyl ester carboxylesterase